MIAGVDSWFVAVLLGAVAMRNGLKIGWRELLTAGSVSMFLWGVGLAHADALWDWYFGAGSARCGEIGNVPEVAVAVGNGLPIASAKPAQLHAWFVAHPQYADEIDRQRRFMQRTCRPD